ncbi:MAG: adenine phosphoribosyltransferase [Nitrospira sp.]|nr:adenine phosphoribosyltransferase [Nitrospira sp.]
MDYKKLIREVPDFPKPGILFYDITTLLKDAQAFRAIQEEMCHRYRDQRISKVIGIESRGFILGSTLAYQLGAGFVPMRKPGKLPANTFEVKYNLEYGSNSLAVHRDAVAMGERVLIVDDLLATGGTAAAAVYLTRQLGAEIVGLVVLVELLGLKGRDKLEDCPVHSMITYA